MTGLAEIRAAAARLQGQVLTTPCVESRTLSQMAGCQVFLKFENLQFTASFKERGACNKLAQLSKEEREHGVIAMSAGNHAQGVAYHAQRLGMRAVIVMPRFTPGVKVERTRSFGAEVVLHGDTLDEARSHALELARAQKLTFVHPYDDEAIVAGQGTTGLEMLEAVPQLDTLVVAIGGGGLIAGIATAAKALKPGIEVVGVQMLRFPNMYNAIKHENLVFFRGKKLANREFRLAYTHAQARTNGVQWVRVVDNWCRRASAMCGFTFEFAEVDDACARRCGGAVV